MNPVIGDKNMENKTDDRYFSSILKSRKITWTAIFMIIISLGVILSCILFTMMVNRFSSSLVQSNQLKNRVELFEKGVTSRLQVLSAGITFDQKRKRLLLKLRDLIQTENSKLTPSQSYTIAENNLDLCDKFKRIDVLLLTALQHVESQFVFNAVSPKGAKGLNQIWPSTARLLCKYLSWEYDEKILLDIEKNTYLACIYLDMLHVQHEGNIELMLAEYNGGPHNAYFYKTNSDKLKKETKLYVAKVLKIQATYKQKISEEL